jgi:hypothetical protein
MGSGVVCCSRQTGAVMCCSRQMGVVAFCSRQIRGSDLLNMVEMVQWWTAVIREGQ